MTHFVDSFADIVSAACFVTWVYLAFFRGRFWNVAESKDVPELTVRRKVLVLIPARDEAGLIGQAVTSLLTQDFPGRIDIVVIDDNSSDQTREVALQAAQSLKACDRVRVLSAGHPAPGWTGKVWTLSQGIQHLGSADADYYLLTDADISHAADNVRGLVARAESGDFDLVSLMVKLRCQSVPERALIPAFVFFFFMLYPPSWVARRDRRTAAAAGGCILIRPDALTRIGGIGAIRGELIDDCALARRVKESGGRIYLGATRHTRSLRPYIGWREIEQMVARSAFTQLRHSTALLAGTLVGMLVVYVSPVLLLAGSPVAALLSAGSWLLMSVCFSPSLRFYNVPVYWAATLPAIALFYMAATFHSAVLHWRGHGGAWKGRLQE